MPCLERFVRFLFSSHSRRVAITYIQNGIYLSRHFRPYSSAQPKNLSHSHVYPQIQSLTSIPNRPYCRVVSASMTAIQITPRTHSAPPENQSIHLTNPRSHRRAPEFQRLRRPNSNPQQPTKSRPTHLYATRYKSIASVQSPTRWVPKNQFCRSEPIPFSDTPPATLNPLLTVTAPFGAARVSWRQARRPIAHAHNDKIGF
jgi:hypothetical protein